MVKETELQIKQPRSTPPAAGKEKCNSLESRRGPDPPSVGIRGVKGQGCPARCKPLQCRSHHGETSAGFPPSAQGIEQGWPGCSWVLLHGHTGETGPAPGSGLFGCKQDATSLRTSPNPSERRHRVVGLVFFPNVFLPRSSPPKTDSDLRHLLPFRSETVSRSIRRLVGVNPDGEKLPGTERQRGFSHPPFAAEVLNTCFCLEAVIEALESPEKKCLAGGCVLLSASTLGVNGSGVNRSREGFAAYSPTAGNHWHEQCYLWEITPFRDTQAGLHDHPVPGMPKAMAAQWDSDPFEITPLLRHRDTQAWGQA